MGKVFLSYSRADSLDFARELHRRLERDGVECFFDEASIDWGDNFVLALENGLDESDHVIVILSPEFVSKEWTTTERVAKTMNDPSNLKHTLLPLLHRPCTLPRFLKPIQYLDVTTSALFDEHYSTICQKLGGILSDDTVSEIKGLLEWPESSPSIDWPIADHSDVHAVFRTLLTQTTTQRLLSLSGPSESGKSLITQQMLGNALRIPDLACGLFNFKGITDLDDELRTFTQHLNVAFPSTGRSLNEKLNTVLEVLKLNPRPTLLIFDTYETVGEAKSWVEELLLTFLIRAPWLRVVISGQRVPKHSGAIWQQNAFPPIILENPPPDDWFKYCQQHRDDVTLDDVKTVCSVISKASLLAQAFGPQR